MQCVETVTFAVMLRYVLILLIFLHGLIHLIGCLRGLGLIETLPVTVSQRAGILWFVAAGIFITTAIMLFIESPLWWLVSLIGVLLSQYLVATAWSSSKAGTILNLIILIAAGLSYGSWLFEQKFRSDLRKANEAMSVSTRLVNKADLKHLPRCVQKYLIYTGALNKPLVKKYTVLCTGKMRDKGKGWFSFSSEQHNYTDNATRLFFMKANMFGLTIPGYHAYKDGLATMDIKLFGLFSVMSFKGPMLDQSETVTLFNDMCVFAPSTLITPAIKWETINDTCARATFTVNRNSIQATLVFNHKGELTNFISDDRYAVADKRKYPFSTPLGRYSDFEEHRLPGYGEAIWQYPDREFVYGKFNIEDVRYNSY